MRRRHRSWIILMVALLLLSGAAYRTVRQEHLNRQLITAIKQDKRLHAGAPEVAACLQSGADPNAREDSYRIDFSWNGLLILLGLKKAPVTSAQSALFLALEGDLTDRSVMFGHEADPYVVKLLVQYGADVRAKDRYGRTPLVAAFRPVPRALMGPGDVKIQSNWECEQAMIEAGADVDALDEQGYTALMEDSHDDALLIKKGADVNAVNQDGTTALICRAEDGDASGCRFLLDHGADVNHISRYGCTALMFAAADGNVAIVNILLQHGANVNANAGQGYTALMAAARCGKCTTMQTLLQRGAVVDVKDEKGWTALTWAVWFGNEAAAQLLLKRGADVRIKDKNGKTLSQLLHSETAVNHDEIRAMIRLLKEHGMRE